VATVPKPKALECPNCGSAVEVRGFGHAVSAVCNHCLSVIDTKSPSLEIIGKFNNKLRVTPLIPLGQRGNIDGGTFEIIGFQDRHINVEGTEYHWQEYLLFNPFKGFRYLIHYSGHWNVVRTLHAIPEYTTKMGKKAMKWQDRTYTHFQSATATTGFVIGEFPWRVKVGEQVMANDYTSAPYSLSSESADMEINWSAGEYITGDAVWKAFNLKDSPPEAQGVYFNQPNPHTGLVTARWRTCWILWGLTIVMFFLTNMFTKQEEVLSREFVFVPGPTSAPGSQASVTPIFELKGRPANVRFTTSTDLVNQWMYVNYALINDQSGGARDFGRLIANFGGDGSPNDNITIGPLAPGRYYLRVDPEWQPDPNVTIATPVPRPVKFRVRAIHDTPIHWPLPFILLVLLLPPIAATFRKLAFEGARWSESDYAGG